MVPAKPFAAITDISTAANGITRVLPKAAPTPSESMPTKAKWAATAISPQTKLTDSEPTTPSASKNHGPVHINNIVIVAIARNMLPNMDPNAVHAPFTKLLDQLRNADGKLSYIVIVRASPASRSDGMYPSCLAR